MFGCSSPIMVDIDGDMEHSHRHFRSSFGSSFVLILLTLDYAAYDDPLLGEAPIHIVLTRNSTSGRSQPFTGPAASSICAPCGGLVGCWGARLEVGETSRASPGGTVWNQLDKCRDADYLLPQNLPRTERHQADSGPSERGCASATGGPQWDDPS